MTRIEKLKSHNISYRFSGLLDIIDSRNTSMLTDEEKKQIMLLKSDDRCIAGRKVSTYAKTALYLVGLEDDIRNDVELAEYIEALSEQTTLERPSQNDASFN